MQARMILVCFAKATPNFEGADRHELRLARYILTQASPAGNMTNIRNRSKVVKLQLSPTLLLVNS
jgi:hypothetical protein